MEATEAPRSKLLPRLWLPLAGIALVGIYGAMFIPALAGRAQDPTDGPASMLWHAVFFALLWKWKLRKGWHGALIGVGAGLLAFVLAAFVGGLNRGG